MAELAEHSTRNEQAQKLVKNDFQPKPAILEDNRESSLQLKQSPIVQRNDTGLPDNLKSGMENLSGINLDNVRVHYNSSKPAAVQAHAYAQGNDIHLASGQEKHLPHELGHVVQQAQGRVKPTTSVDGVAVNDNSALENEATKMGEMALQRATGETKAVASQNDSSPSLKNNGTAIVQKREIGLFGLEAEVLDRFTFTTFDDATNDELGLDHDAAYPILNDPNVVLEEHTLGDLDGLIKVTLDNEVTIPNTFGAVERSYTLEFVQKPVDVLARFGTVKETAVAWAKASALWKLLYDSFVQDGHTQQLQAAMQTMEGANINQQLVSEQFSDHANNDLVTTENTQDGDVFSLDWTALSGTVEKPTQDPMVAPQLTAGASLIAIEQAYLATQQPLYFKQALSPQLAVNLKINAPENSTKLGNSEALGLIKLLKRYAASTRPQRLTTKRYMKEYVPLMTRNSLDSIFASMSTRGQQVFIFLTKKYLAGEADNFMLKIIGVAPDAPVFNQTSTKEADAEAITMEDLIFSIIKMKRNELGNDIENDEEAEAGDSFSQADLEGMSEIRNDRPESLEKYGIDSADEMMRGEKGIIFENRLAKSIPLSEMPTLFMNSANALRTVQDIYDTQRAQQREEAYNRRMKEDAYKATNNEYAYQY